MTYPILSQLVEERVILSTMLWGFAHWCILVVWDACFDLFGLGVGTSLGPLPFSLVLGKGENVEENEKNKKNEKKKVIEKM